MAKELFYCKSLNLVAFIMSKGIKLDGYNTGRNKAVFYFEKSEQLDNVIKQYNDNEELKAFISSFKEVKDILKNKSN